MDYYRSTHDTGLIENADRRQPCRAVGEEQTNALHTVPITPYILLTQFTHGLRCAARNKTQLLQVETGA